MCWKQRTNRTTGVLAHNSSQTLRELSAIQKVHDESALWYHLIAVFMLLNDWIFGPVRHFLDLIRL